MPDPKTAFKTCVHHWTEKLERALRSLAGAGLAGASFARGESRASGSTPAPAPYVARFESLAYGLFVHYGLYSLSGKGEWVKRHHDVPMEDYRKLIDRFTAEDFDARELARFARRCGMRYIVLTTRHHEGFSLYDTRGLNEFDAPHSPAGRDLIAEFVEACRAEDIVPFFYHTTLDWSWNTETCDDQTFAEYIDYLVASVELLCTHYGSVGGFWFDGNWSRRDADWQEDRLYGMIRRLQPEAMIINNSSINALGALGHPELDAATYEQGRPAAMDRNGMPRYKAAEMCQTMNLHWGIAENDLFLKSPADVVTDLAACRRVGANYLLNIGPTATGAIPAYEKVCLERAGDWVNRHAEALYETRPCAVRTEGEDFVLRHTGTGSYYYFAHNLPIRKNDHKTKEMGATEGPRPIAGIDTPLKTARWLDNDEPLDLHCGDAPGEWQLNCTAYPYGSNLVVRVAKLEA